MADNVQNILSTDTLETGFRAKANNNFDQIIVDYSFPAATGQQPNGYTLRLKLHGGGFIDINLQQFYYTKQQLLQVLQNFTSSPYLGLWTIPDATAGKYVTNVVVDYNGRFWRSNANTTEADVPGVSNKWVDLITPILSIWDIALTYIKDATVRKFIGGFWYQFASQNDGNTTEPTLTPGVDPWTQTPSAVYGGAFVPASSYLNNQAIVDGVNIYLRNATASPGGGDPQPSTDVSHTYWTLIGAYKGLWDAGFVGGYSIGDVAIDGANNVYVSTIAANADALDDPSTMQWDLIGNNTDALAPARIVIAAGQPNPIILNALADYSAYGNTPKVAVMLDLGGNDEQERYDMSPIRYKPAGVLNTLTFDNGGGAVTIDNLIIYIG